MLITAGASRYQSARGFVPTAFRNQNLYRFACDATFLEASIARGFWRYDVGPVVPAGSKKEKNTGRAQKGKKKSHQRKETLLPETN